MQASRKPPLQSRLQPVVLAGAERRDKGSGRRPSELLQQRATGLIGADHLARVDVQISELPDLPCGHVSRLRHKTQTELLLQREVPGLEIASLEVLRIAAECIST